MRTHKALKKHMPTCDDFPAVVPILPLGSMVLLPRARLPLPIVSAHQFSVIAQAWSHDRYVGVLQPQPTDHTSSDIFKKKEGDTPFFYQSGCLARMTEIGEFEDGKLFVMLMGVCRFHLMEHLRRPIHAPQRGEVVSLTGSYFDHGESLSYPVKDEDTTHEEQDDSADLSKTGSILYGRVDYRPYAIDLGIETDYVINRPKLLEALTHYFEHIDVQADPDDLQKISDTQLISTLAMTYPFSSRERQAVLQCPTLSDQSKMMLSLIDMAKRDYMGIGERMQ